MEKKNRFSKGIKINNGLFNNSAAKFWPAVIDEISLRFPKCKRFEIETYTSAVLSWDTLYPVLALEEELNRMFKEGKDVSLEEMMNSLIFDGPPAAVILRVWFEDKDECSVESQLEALDESILNYLAAWLLRWANIDESKWNIERISGEVEFNIEAEKRKFVLIFTVIREYISEGLFRRTIEIKYNFL